MFQEKLYRELRARLAIDALRLDEELVQQPPLLQSAAEAAADAAQIRDAAKNALDIAGADAARKLRVIPDDNGKLPSEERIKSLLPLDVAVQNAVAEFDEAKHDLAYWQALADSFAEKGSALRRVAQLTLNSHLTPNAAYEQRREEMNSQRVKIRR